MIFSASIGASATPIRALTVGVTRLAPADQVVEQVSFSTWGTRSVNGRKSWRRLLTLCGKSTAREA